MQGVILAIMSQKPGVNKMMKQADELWAHDSPFRSIYTLMAIHTRTKTAEKFEDCIAYIMDQLQCDNLPASSVTERNCNGRANVSLCDVSMKKREMVKHLLTPFADKYEFRQEVI